MKRVVMHVHLFLKFLKFNTTNMLFTNTMIDARGLNAKYNVPQQHLPA